MIASFLFFMLILSFFRCKEYFCLTKDRCDILKAIFPFIIIIGHCSFFIPDNYVLDDFRWLGPYIVGIFFFISGYGLQYKYSKSAIDLHWLRNRMKALLLPVILPVLMYICIVCNGWDSFRIACSQATSQGNLILPYSWFVIVIAIFYVTYYLIRTRIKKNYQFYWVYFILLIALAGIMNRIGWSSSCYVSNIAFILGILYKDKEDVMLKYINMRG